MSGVVKGIKKAFKAVVKVVKKVAPIIIAAAAIYFTAGAALGLTGGMTLTSASTGLASSLGLTTATGGLTTLGATVAGAAKFAMIGSLTGGAMAAVQGKNILKGAGKGALMGGITGGVLGATGMAGLETAGAAESAGGGLQEVQMTGLRQATDSIATATPLATGAPLTLAAPSMTPGAAPAAGTGLQQTPAIVPPATPEAAGFFDKGGWLQNNGALAGGIVGGLGTGLMGFASAKSEEAQAEKKAQRVAENYRGGTGLMQPTGNTSGAGMPSPSQRFSANAYQPGEYVWDPSANRYVLMPARV